MKVKSIAFASLYGSLVAAQAQPSDSLSSLPTTDSTSPAKPITTTTASNEPAPPANSDTAKTGPPSPANPETTATELTPSANTETTTMELAPPANTDKVPGTISTPVIDSSSDAPASTRTLASLTCSATQVADYAAWIELLNAGASAMESQAAGGNIVSAADGLESLYCALNAKPSGGFQLGQGPSSPTFSIAASILDALGNVVSRADSLSYFDTRALLARAGDDTLDAALQQLVDVLLKFFRDLAFGIDQGENCWDRSAFVDLIDQLSSVLNAASGKVTATDVPTAPPTCPPGVSVYPKVASSSSSSVASSSSSSVASSSSSSVSSSVSLSVSSSASSSGSLSVPSSVSLSVPSSVASSVGSSVATSPVLPVSGVSSSSAPMPSGETNKVSGPSAGTTVTTAPWKTHTLPELDCPAPTETVYRDWLTEVSSSAEGLIAGVAAGVLDIAGPSARDMICEFNDLVSLTVPVNAHEDLPLFASANGAIVTGLSDLSAKADLLTLSVSARDLFARADITLTDYAEALASGAIIYAKLMSAAIATDSDCADRASFSSLNDALSTAVASLASKFSFSAAYPTAPPLCSGSPTTSCTPCPPGATDCVPCPPVVCETCVPICTASPCVPVCPTCEVATTVVTAFTTYCPGPTTICTNNVCHTVTEATKLTITDCPCTIVTVVTPSPSPLITPNGPAGTAAPGGGSNPGSGAGGAGSNPGSGAGGAGSNPGSGAGGAGSNPGSGSGGAGSNPGSGAGGAGSNPGSGAGGAGSNPGSGAGGAGSNPGSGAGGAGSNPGADSTAVVPVGTEGSTAVAASNGAHSFAANLLMVFALLFTFF